MSSELSENIKQKFTALLDAIAVEKDNLQGLIKPFTERKDVFNFYFPEILMQFAKLYEYEGEGFDFIKLAGFVEKFIEELFKNAYKLIYPALLDLFKNKDDYIKYEHFNNAKYHNVSAENNEWGDKIALHLCSDVRFMCSYVVIWSKNNNTKFRIDLYDIIPNESDFYAPNQLKFSEKIAEFDCSYRILFAKGDISLKVGSILGCINHFYNQLTKEK